MCASAMSPLYSDDESILRYMSNINKKDTDYYMENKCPHCKHIIKPLELDHADIICPECHLVLMGTIPYTGLKPVDYPWGLNI